ncbi:hypothetical protein P154DRAFT_524517 [Amniculicola lignicola CBS 123094]|uniref:CHAT domain-containing protein n=1 Tax=Amniculicola lignicola CBS 123094 TaxID=1392246 RepID=A0A6A5W759_9PLEO|nr:hypothetical protein P154DRAFT_524517 [Amniculicola lignicola CBS 123094]
MDVDLMIERGQRALAEAPEGHPDRLQYLEVLFALFGDRCSNKRHDLTLDNAIRYGEQLAAMMPDEYPNANTLLQSLSNFFMYRYQLARNMQDIDAAIIYRQRLSDVLPVNNPGYMSDLYGLGQMFQARFRRTENMDDLSLAIVHLTNASDPEIGNPNHLKALATCLSERFRRRTEITDLDRAIEYQIKIIEMSPEHDSSRSIWFRELAWHLHWRFQRLGDRIDMDKSLLYFEQALQTSTEQDVQYPVLLHDVGVAYRSMFFQSRDLSHLQTARAYRTRALVAAPANHPHRPFLLNGLASVLSDLFEQTNDALLLEDALRYGYEAIDIATQLSINQSSLVPIFGNLGKARLQQSRQYGDSEILDEAIQFCQKAVDLTPISGLEYLPSLMNLGSAYSQRYFQKGASDDLDISIHHLQTVLEAMLDNHYLRSECLLSLSVAITRRFYLMGCPNDLAQSIVYSEEGLKITHENHSMRPNHLSNLGISLCSRFGRDNTVDDMKRGIAYCKEAVALTVGTGPNHAIHLTALGFAYQEVFERTYEVEDATSAVQYLEQASQNVGNDPVRQTEYLKNLGSAWISRYQRTGAANDLEDAIRYGEEAVRTGSTTASLELRLLNILSVAFSFRFSRLGQGSDLAKAIKYDQQALSLTRDKSPFRMVYLNNLARSLGERYKVSQRMADLEAAIRLSEQVSAQVLEDHLFFAQFLETLARLLFTKFLRTGQIQDIERSISCIRKSLGSVEALSEGHPSRSDYLDDLGNAFAAKYRLLRQNVDIESSIQYGLQAVALTPEGTLEWAFRLHNLASHMEDRFDSTNSMDDLAQSINLHQKAVDLAPKNHPSRLALLSYLGGALEKGSDRLKMEDAFLRSTEAFIEGLSCNHGSPVGRLLCGIHAVFSLGKVEKWDKAVVALEKTLDIIPDLISGTISKADMQRLVQTFFGFGYHAASVLLKANRTSLQAFQALESCRGLIASLVMDSRQDLSALKSSYPGLCTRYTQCLDEISSMNTSVSALNPGSLETSDRVIFLFESLDKMREEIRAQPGFERFLLPPTEKELLELAQHGPIVSLSVSNVSAEAFLLTTAGVDVLPLPEVNIDTILGFLRLFQSQGNRTRREATVVSDNENDQTDVGTNTSDSSVPTMNAALQYIWKGVVKPILQRLQLLQDGSSQPSSLPRLWWIGGGVLSLIPLHAAGYHEPGSIENTVSHVISSYAPTLKALRFLRKKDKVKIVGQKHEVLVVSMPTTPGRFHPLNVGKEVDAIKTFVKPWADVTVLERPNKAEVIKALGQCTIAHFACHGTADPVEPTKSNLLLGRDKLERMAIEDFDTIVFETASIIYLSACSTAELKVRNLADESIHLASSFQLAGFQHVIGTLWGAKDRAAVEVAKKFYEVLHEATEGSEMAVAEALHNAVCSLRSADNNWENVSLWGPFIHLGT